MFSWRNKKKEYVFMEKENMSYLQQLIRSIIFTQLC